MHDVPSSETFGQSEEENKNMAKLLITDRPLCLIGSIQVKDWPLTQCLARARTSMTGAKVCMVGPDWDALDAHGGIPEDAAVRIEDEQTLTVGDTEFTFYHTPGHTLGTMSIAFDVRDGDDTYRAFTFGGAGLNFNGIDRTEMYLKSVRRVQTFDELQVALPNHAFMANVFERSERLAERKPGDPHPFVAPGDLQETWRQLIQDAELKLAQEKARAGL